MNDSRDFQDAESVRSGHSHVTSQPVLFPPHPIPEGMISRSIRMPSCREGPPSIWDTYGISGNVFANPIASSSAPCPQELNPWSSGREEPILSSTVEKSEKQTPVQDQRCRTVSQKFSHPQWGKNSNNYGADQQRLQISDLHFDKFPTQATFACWKIRFKTEICTCSQFPTEAILWIKEVELADSVDDLRSSSSARGIRMPDFDVLDARIASALNKIIHISHFGRRISLEEHKAQKQDSFLRGRRVAHLIHEYFRVTGARPYWNCMTWRFIRRKQDLIITDWKRWWKEVSSKIYETRILAPETEIMKETPWSRTRGQNSLEKEFLETVGNESPTGSVPKETIAVSVTILVSVQKMTQPNPSPNSFKQQNERKSSRTRSPRRKSPSGRMSRLPCKDYLKGTCNNSFCERWHPPECLFYKTKSGCRFGEKCSYAHRQVDEQPTKRSKKNDDKSAVAMLKKGDWHERGPITDQSHDLSGKPDKRSDKMLGRRSSQRRSSNTRQLDCVLQDMGPPKSILRKSSDMRKPIWRVKFTEAVARHAYNRDQNPSAKLQRSKIEDRSQEETEWQEQGAREAAWKLTKSVLNLKEQERATFFSPSENRCLPACINS